jgi:hypothetical protein
LIHNHQDPVGPQRGRLAAEQLHTPEAVFHGTRQRQPGGPSGGGFGRLVMGENPSHHTFVEWKVDAKAICWAARIPLLHFHNRMYEFCSRSFRAGLATAIGRTAYGTFAGIWLGERPNRLRPSAQWQSAADDWNAPTTPASRQGPGPTPIDSARVGSRSGRFKPATAPSTLHRSESYLL